MRARTIHKGLWVLAALAWAALLMPLFIGALGAHPATDDYVFTGITHNTWLDTHSLPHVVKDALSYALRTYRDWQGTITGIVVMCLNPAFISTQAYAWHAPVLLALWLACFYAFLRVLLVGRFGFSRAACTGTFFVLTLLQWVFVPSLLEGLYWHNGAWFYTGTTAVFFLTLALLLHGRRAGRIAALALLAFIGLNNYITAALSCALLALLTLADAWRARQGGRTDRGLARFGVPLAVVLACLLISVLAPGNRVRMETDAMYGAQSLWPLRSLVWTARDALGYVWRFLFKTPLLCVLVLCFAFAVRMARGVRFSARYPGIVTLAAYVLLCAMIFPHMFTSGYAGPGRIVNLYHHYVVTAGGLLALYWAVWLAQRGRTCRRRIGLCMALAALLLAVVLTGGRMAGDYAALTGEIASGQLLAYRRQTQRATVLLEAAGEADVVRIPPEEITSVTGMHTGGAQADHWQNQALAVYYGVAGVVVDAP